ncbi:MAG TPA: ROK family protein [Burkholderiales bacterium]|jgi:fructokinase|nr:ROK family protein [Burkholderiales bacterium]
MKQKRNYTRIGVDLGGSKIEAIALDSNGKSLVRKRIATPKGDYEGTVRAVAALVLETEKKLGKKGRVGVGIPGALSRVTGLVKNANSTWLIGRDLKTDFEQALDREVRLANDANCFALSEAVDGAAAGAEVVFGVILGTGVGGGVVVRGEVLTGPNGIAGEWGHNPLPLPQEEDLPLPECYCGRKGCIETYLCGPALEKNPDMDRYEERLARALAGVINVLDPDVIVLGGGISNVRRLYANVPRLWEPYVFSDQVATRLVQNRHGDSSGVRGAAWLWGRN